MSQECVKGVRHDDSPVNCGQAFFPGLIWGSYSEWSTAHKADLTDPSDNVVAPSLPPPPGGTNP